MFCISTIKACETDISLHSMSRSSYCNDNISVKKVDKTNRSMLPITSSYSDRWSLLINHSYLLVTAQLITLIDKNNAHFNFKKKKK